MRIPAVMILQSMMNETTGLVDEAINAENYYDGEEWIVTLLWAQMFMTYDNDLRK